MLHLTVRETFLLSVIILFCAFCCRVATDDCNPGQSSPGWIYPRGDVHMLMGNPIEMYCTLNQSHPLGVGYTSQNLSFVVDSTENYWPVERVNNTAIRLYVEESTVSADNHYVVTCRLGEKGICTRHVYVGYKPVEVTDFQCISYNWERLECTWNAQANPVQTIYTLSYASSIMSRDPSSPSYRSGSPCPEYLLKPDNRTPYGCFYTRETRPYYRNSLQDYHFTMDIDNPLGSIVQQMPTVDVFALMVPDPMVNLTAVSIGQYSVTIYWDIPSALHLFPPGLRYRVGYKIDMPWSDESLHEIDTSSLNVTRWNITLPIQVPYPNTNYQFFVWARSASANETLERFWSQPAKLSVTSAADRPCAPPLASMGSFEVFNTRLETRSATIYWSQIEPQCENGPDAGYVVDMLDLQGNFIKSLPLRSTSFTSVKFDDLNREQHLHFRIKSSNRFGHSINASVVYLPADTAMPLPPQDVRKIVFGGTLYEIQWNPPPPKQVNSLTVFTKDHVREQGISSYTVYWCRSIRDNPVSCEGDLNTRLVPASQTSVGIAVSDPKSNYQFAVEANQGHYASGMVWSGCVIDANGNGSQVKQIEVPSVSNMSIDLQWSLPCSQQNGIITGFNIYYCSVTGDDANFGEEPICTGEEIRIRVGPAETRRSITGLDPFTWYKMVLSVQTRFGEGQSSKPLVNRTSEGVPSPPLDLKWLDVTNESISVQWSPPKRLRGGAPSYYIFLNDTFYSSTGRTKVVLDDAIRSYTNYRISVQACHEFLATPLCSEPSEPVSVLTKIGVPSAPNPPKVKAANNQSHPSAVSISWSAPERQAGPLDMYNIEMKFPAEKESRLLNSSTNSRIIETVSADLCPPGYEMSVRIQAVNRNEEDQLLMSEWSPIEVSPCPSSGLELWHILGIALSVVAVVLMVVAFSFLNRRFRIQKKAEQIAVILPWEQGGNRPPTSDKPSNGLKSAKPANSSVGGIGGSGFVLNGSATSVNNHYGRLESKLSGGAIITNMAATTNIDNKVDSDSISERQSRSSGCGSAHDSISWHHTSRSEISNSDSGAELEPPNSPSPDCGVFDETLDALQGWKGSSSDKTMVALTTLENADVMKGDVDPSLVHYSTINFVEAQFDPVPDVTVAGAATAAPYVRFGVVPSAENNLQPAKSAGYVTLGEAGNNGSSNSSPNLSAGSNESLISKKERSSFSIASLQNGDGYVDSVSIPASNGSDGIELVPSASQGYVTLKTVDSPETSTVSSAAQTSSTCATEVTSHPLPSSKAPPRGYVTLGSVAQVNHHPSSDVISVHPVSNTHYVTLGVEPGGIDPARHASYI